MVKKDWTEVYAQLAKELFNFQKRHGAKVGEKLFTLLDEDLAHRYTATWLEKFKTSEKRSIDPIAFFSSFNDSKQGTDIRLERINDYFRLLGVDPGFDEIDFDGCPTPFAVKLMSVRSSPNQSVLWTTFRNVMLHGQGAIDNAVFVKLGEIYGIGIPSFTIWLFWIRPNDFLPLDRNTVRYLITAGYLESEPKTFAQYLVAMKQPFSFPEISRNAVAEMQRSESRRIPNPEQNIYVPIEKMPGIHETDPDLPEAPVNEKDVVTDADMVPKNFRLLGVELIADPLDRYRKSLELNKTYHFYKAFQVHSNSQVTYFPEKDLQLYSQKGLSINISAVVGQNGSGKSALTELLYLAINNLAFAHLQIKTDLEEAPELHMRLYYLSDFLFRLEWENDLVRVFRYKQHQTLFSEPEEIELADFDLSQFFFSIGINYSIYGLNSRHLGKWLEKIFIKNDAYQVPVTLNPYRIRGNVDINIEEHLVKSRLLSNVLQPVSTEEPETEQLRQLTDTKKAAELLLTLNRSKFASLYIIKDKSTGKNDKIYKFSDSVPYFMNVLETLCDTFGLSRELIPKDPDSPETVVDYAFLYILKKLIAISRTYSSWEGYFDEENNAFINESKFIRDLFYDHSHITYKLRQAVNFIKQDHIRRFLAPVGPVIDVILDVDKLSDAIEFAKQNEPSENRQTIYFIPPSFFNTKIIMSDGSDFARLSSGQMQRIFSVTTLAYHLINLNSISPVADTIAYRFVNVIFDEVELYFHPEMQRNMLSHMLKYIQKLELDQIDGLNIMLITHSPFILSDIPHHNILFMKSEEPDIQTLGANIHDLLANNFFLSNGFMGERVKHIILQLMTYLDPKTEVYPDGWTPQSAKSVINAIGEPLIRMRLEQLYNVRFKALISKEERITNLRRELMELENLEEK